MDANTTKYKDYSIKRENFRALRIGASRETIEEGGIAFWAGVSPDHCPYLNVHGDNVDAVLGWMLGWSKQYREDAEAGFTPAWSDELGRVLGKKD